MLVSGKGHVKVVGTPDYMAPEMLNSTTDINPSIDWWAIGCIVYELIVGIPPFNAETIEEVWGNIRNCRIEWPNIGYDDDSMTPEAQDLIMKLLEVDPSKRISCIDEVKDHPFFSGRVPSQGISWDNLTTMQPPMVPHLNKIEYKKDTSIPLTQIFDGVQVEGSNNRKLAHKYKRQNIEGVRYDLLHEENLNHLVEVA